MEGFTLLKHGESVKMERKEPNLISPGSSSNRGGKSFKSTMGSVPLVNESFELLSFIKSKLSDSEPLQSIVGIVGLQGSGKSTLMSMLAGNNPQDQFRQYIFRPATKDSVDGGFYQTSGLSVYMSASRNIYIDCRPFNCGAVLEEYNKRSRGDGKNQYKGFQADDLTLISTVLDICHSVILAIDWFVDMNMVQELLRASLYSEFNCRKFAGYQKKTNLVIVHQRAQPADFDVNLVKERVGIIKSLFKDSRLDINGGLSMQKLGFERYSECDENVNYVLLSELPLWNKDSYFEVDVNRIPYNVVIEKLKKQILRLSRPSFRTISTHRTLRLRPDYIFDKNKLRAKDKRGDFGDKGGRDHDDSSHIFNPEHLPNITSKQSEPPPVEPWNDLDSILALSPSHSVESALNAVKLLYLTSKGIKDDEFVSGLLPAEEQGLTELGWFGYVDKVFKNHLDYYHSKYFLTNNGRLAPVLLRKLKGSSRIIYKKERNRTGRPERRGPRVNRASSTTEDQEEEIEEEERTSELDGPDSEHSSESAFTDDESSDDESESDTEKDRSKKFQRRRAASDSSS